MTGGAMLFLQVGHDDACPGRYTDGEGCTCSPTLTFHSDPAHVQRCEAVNRAMRCKVAREAEKALRMAARRAKP